MPPSDSASALRPASIPSTVTGALTALGLCAALYALATIPDITAPFVARMFSVLWLTLSVICSIIIAPRNFVLGYLGGLFCLLSGWRIPGLLGLDIVAWALVPAFLAFLAQFVDCLRADRRRAVPLLSVWEWQLTALRIYIGFDLVPHFTEKLFAGPVPFNADVIGFRSFGLPMPAAFVIVGGLCEFGIALGLGAGLLTRVAVVGGAAYFMIATLVGGHFGNGFIWASPNGGWEYPLLMMVLMLSYALPGAGKFSVDQVLDDQGWWPASLRRLASG